ncbi:MAG: DNA-processing protein DprA [Spirochaetales bacterium]|nr:DNA-processing protein DprA [Spirochaetales bacterium]
MSIDTLLALAINRLSVLKSNEKMLLAEVVDTAEFYRSLDHRALGRVIGRPLREDLVLPEDTLRAAEKDLLSCSQRNVAIVTFWDSPYPAALREIFDPPFLLFVRGHLPDPERPSIAVVGTREPTAAAVIAARRLAEGIAMAGSAVVSGLARGIDASAHRGALRARTDSAGVVAPTGAVLGSGIDRIYPASHRSLAAAILSAGGFLMSEYSPGIDPAKYHFPARNRIISGMSRGVVVVQAPAKSGALITADYALDHGRDLFVHAAGLSGAVGAGTRDLADDGARIIDGPQGIFEEWGVPVPTGLATPVVRPAGADLTANGRDGGRHLADELRRVLVLEQSDE